MGSFTRWYIHALKTRPLLANMATASILMTTGDVLAQELEHGDIGDEFVGRQHSNIPEDKRLSLKRYGSVNSNAAQKAAIDAADQKKKKKNQENTHQIQRKEGTEENNKNNEEDPLIQIRNATQKAIDTVSDEFQFLDGYRTCTMICWSSFIYTPFYVQIYKLYDKYLPKQTPATVLAKVAMSLILSIPLNAAFFCYGTCIHHTAEWIAVRKEWALELQASNTSPVTCGKSILL